MQTFLTTLIDSYQQWRHWLKYSHLVLFLLFSSVATARAPEFPSPPDSKVEWVGQDIEMNGIRTAIRAFHSRNSIEKVVEFYRKEWRRPVERNKPGYMETIDAAPWYIISRIEDGYLLTVQVQVQKNNKNASWGYLAISPLPEDPEKQEVELGTSTPKMPGSHVVNEMKSNDPGKKANTLIIANTHSIGSNAAFYRNHYEGRGWTTETDFDAQDVHTLVFKTRRERVTIMLLKDGSETRVVVNSVKNSVF